MSGVQILFDAHGLPEAEHLLDRLALRFSNLAPALKSFGEYLLLRTDERFEAERGPDGEAWEPLSPVTLALKGKGEKILTGRTKMLRGRIAYNPPTANELRIGTNVPYGAIHQLGGKAGRGRKVKIPARPYLGVNADDERELWDTVTAYLEIDG